MSDFLTLDDVDAKGKTVIVRVDFNVPVKNGQVADFTRLKRSLPTLDHLSKINARIILLSHFGRPKGKLVPEYSLRPIATALANVWGQPVLFAEDCIGPKAHEGVNNISAGQVILFENVRFHPEEEKNDLNFAKELASFGNIFVNDAFSAAHRAHASTEGITRFLPSVAGRLMQEELEALSKALEKPEKPMAAIVGGSKISTKLDVLYNLINKADFLIPGGGMANTFLAAEGFALGKSLVEMDMLDTAQSIIAKANQSGCKILLPQDVVIAPAIEASTNIKTVSVREVPSDMMVLDLGPQTVSNIKEILTSCRTLVWNGPLGVFEVPPFDAATNEIAHHVAKLSRNSDILSVAGGGDTVAALARAGVTDDISYVSTAGGAFLEWLEGKELPGVAALRRKFV